MPRLRYAGLTGSLATGGLTASATSHTFPTALTYANGVTVPTLTGSDYFLLTILSSGRVLSEVIKITAYDSSTKTATLVRGQEGTTGIAHSAGDAVTQYAYPSDFVNRDLRWTCPNNEISYDEFNDDSLSSALTRVDGTNAPVGNVTWAEAGDALNGIYPTAAVDTGNAVHAILMPIGTPMVAGDAFYTCVTVFGVVQVNHSIANLVLATGNTYGAGSQVISETYMCGNALPNGVNQENSIGGYINFTTSGQGTGGGIVDYTPAGVPTFVRTVYLGSNVWRTDRSSDGIQWLKGAATLTYAITPTYVGLGVRRPSTSGKHSASFEFLRRQSGVS